MNRRQFLGGVAATGCLCGLSACSTNLATGRSSFTAFMSPEDEIKLGNAEHPKLLKSLGGEYVDPKLSRYITDIGRRVASVSELQGLPYEFTVLNTSIVNAMALPGGHVYITRGLIALAGNEAELAGVLAHEVGHVNARHTAERYSQAMLTSIGAAALGIVGSVAGIGGGIGDIAQMGADVYLQGYSRDQELEADMLGIRYLTRAGYDSGAMVSFLSTLREHDLVTARMEGRSDQAVDSFNMMATHPRTIDRVQQAIQASQSVRQSNPRIGRVEYMARANGLVFGDDPSQGVVKGDLFIHPEMRFEFTVPHGFRLVNGEKSVVAKHPSGAVIIFDTARSKRADSMARYLQEEWASNITLHAETLTINGMDGATGAARVQTQSRKIMDLRLVAARRDANTVYRFIFLTPVGETTRLAQDLKRTTYSLRPTTSSDVARAGPLRLLVVPVRAGDTERTLSAGLPFGEFNEDWFRLLNGLLPGQHPQPGSEVKIVGG